MENKNKKTKTGQNVSIDGRVLPNNFEAEQVVLGSALIDNEATLLIVSKLEDIDFYNDTHKKIYCAIKDLFKESHPVDFISVADELERKGYLDGVGGLSYMTTLSNIVPSSSSCGYYIDIVKRCSILRQLIQASGSVIEKAYTQDADISLIGVAEKSFFDIAEKGQTGALEKIDKSVQGVIEKFETIHREGGATHGLKTGFYQIDKVTNGLQKTDLIILAARPGVGKTSLAMNIVSNAAIDSGAKCAIFSFEMGRDQLATRMLCSVANVSMAKALRGELSSSDWEKIWRAKKQLDEAEIYIDVNSGNTPSQILSKCRKLKREKGLDLVVIDYIGLMKSDEKSESRQNQIAGISIQLKALAKDLEIPVITLCQLNRDIEKQETGKDGKPRKPVLSDLRESGQIEQDADMVWFIHRDMTKNEIKKDPNKNYVAELIIAKFRNGEPGSVFLGWDGSRTSFYNLERDANEQSLVNAYEKNAEQKKSQKEDIDNIKSRLNNIINEMGVTSEDNSNLEEKINEYNSYYDSAENLSPPPENFENNNDEAFGGGMKDFSDVSIDDDEDELF